MPRRTVLVALAAAATTALIVPAASQGAAPGTAPSAESAASSQASGGPQAFAARNCRLGRRKSRRLGPTYTTSLKVRRVGCRKGRRLVTAYYECRVRNGGRDGHCGRVGRWRCNERRFNEIPTQYDARVKCKRGRKVVRHTYTQYT